MPRLSHAHKHHHQHDHDQHHSPPRAGLALEEIPLDGLTADQYRSLLDEAHHSIEEEKGGGFISRWRDKFRFEQMFLNAYRWYQMHQGRPEVANAAANIATMLIASHSLETVGGMALASSGASHGLDGLLGAGMAAVGVTITIPGLDPLCLLLIGAYGRWPAVMDKALTYPRLFVVKSYQGALSLAGFSGSSLRELLDQTQARRFAGRLELRPDVHMTARSSEGAQFWIFGTGPGQTVVLDMKPRDDGRLMLTSVQFSLEAGAMVRAYLEDLVRPFGRNISALVMEIDSAISARTLGELESRTYVRRIEKSAQGATTVHLAPGAFPFLPLHRLPCSRSLLNVST